MTQYVNEKVANIERPMTAWILVGMCLFFIFVYAGFVNAAVGNIVATKDMQAEISSVASSVSELESTYLAAKSAINIDEMLALGFAPAGSVDTIYIAKSSLGLSLNR